ncbi:hypothetical protein EH165_09795 [Nakamurella antarctica]|uniref:Uncharacterized protein n=1 Tax=Nakamurella antarctica TaxID=1902245 RepID=A0A3G8ZM14_9ACTN|nr:hypothetical protein [Nakamurella antarctica]AZI58389.1 hypothetical protein EH165_09795 [Nakamurella antarctica]
MARLREPEQSTPTAESVPAALKDPMGSTVWRQTATYDRWCRKYLGKTIKLHSEGTYWRYDAAMTEWCRQNGLMSERFPTHVDYQRAKDAGIGKLGALRRSQLNCEDGNSDAIRLVRPPKI